MKPRLQRSLAACGALFSSALFAMQLFAQASPVLSLTATPTMRATRGTQSSRRSVTLALHNSGATPAQVQGSYLVEREMPSGWTPAAQPFFDYATSCNQRTPRCVVVPAHGTLAVDAWDTMTCGSCECSRNGPVMPGRYRIVARTCDGSQTVTSAPFELGSE